MAKFVEAAATPRPTRAIPARRDRLQSLALASILTASIACAIIFGIFATGHQGGRYQIAAVSLVFATIVALMRSATFAGALCGALACFSTTWWTRDLDSPLLHSALPPLLALFVLTFIATRSGKRQKQLRGLAERTGGRSAAQVMANLGVAALAATPLGAYAAALTGLQLPVSALLLAAACLAALAEATADTVSSEIGQAFGRHTYLLTSLRRVHRGIDGGVSILGTAAGAAAALLVVLVGGWSLRLSAAQQALTLVAALLGFVADSLLGATIERRGWIGNDLVNLTSTAVSALSMLLIARSTSAFQ